MGDPVIVLALGVYWLAERAAFVRAFLIGLVLAVALQRFEGGILGPKRGDS